MLIIFCLTKRIHKHNKTVSHFITAADGTTEKISTKSIENFERLTTKFNRETAAWCFKLLIISINSAKWKVLQIFFQAFIGN